MEAMILVGGLGTRLKTVVPDLPKPMADINGRPFLSYLLDDLNQKGIKRIILCVGYKSDVIMNFYGNQYKSMELVYSIEDEPLGTGGAIKKAMTLVKEEVVLVYNGDTYFDVDANDFTHFHKSNHGMISITLKEMKQFNRYGTVELEDHRIINFNEKQYRDEGIINGGIYCINRSLFEQMETSNKFSFETEVLEKHLNNLVINGKVYNGYFIDIGIPEDYHKASMDFRSMFRGE